MLLQTTDESLVSKMPNEEWAKQLEATDSLHVMKAIGRVRELGVRSEDNSTVVNLCTEIAMLKQEVERLRNLLEPKDLEIITLRRKLKERQKNKNANQEPMQIQERQEISTQENGVQTECMTSSTDSYTQTSVETVDTSSQATLNMVDNSTQNEILHNTDQATQVRPLLRSVSTQTQESRRYMSAESERRIRLTMSQTSSENSSVKLPSIKSDSGKKRTRSLRRPDDIGMINDKTGYHKNCIPQAQKSKSWVF